MNYSLFKTKKTAADKNNVEGSLKLAYRNLGLIKENYEVYTIKNFGRLVEVESYYHEVDQYYKCVGFEVEIESQFFLGEGDNKELTDLETQIGFYSIWVGKSHPAAPFTFEESHHALGEARRFDNGLGDHASVTKVIATKEEVQHVAKGLIS